MLQVQKKKKNGNGLKVFAIVLLILLLAGSISIYLLKQNETVRTPEKTETRGILLSKEKGSLTRATVHVRDREPWTAVRDQHGILKLESSDGLPIDHILGERMEDALENLVYEDVLTDDPKEYQERLSEFGLSDPALTVKAAYSDGTEITFRVGNDSGLEDADFRFMIVDGDNRLFAVAGSLMEDLSMEKELFYSVEQPDIQTSCLDRIRILNGREEVLYEWMVNEKITDTESTAGWILHTSKIIYPADADQINNMKKNAANLRLGLYISEADSADLTAYGLDNPNKIIEIHMAAGSNEMITEEGVYQLAERQEETLRFLIGSSRNEMTDFVLYEDRIYTINHFTVAALTEINPASTLNRHPVSVPTESIRSLTVERAEGPCDEYTLEYTADAGELEGDPGKALIRCYKNGQPFSYETFAAAFERWRVATVSGELPEGWKKQRSETRYTIKTISGSTYTVELSPFDGMHEAVTVDGWTLFYIIKNGLEPLL